MRILLTGTEGSGIEQVDRALRAAGNETLSCLPDPGSRGRCKGTEDKSACPYASGVDVIVAARAHPVPNLTRQEHLSECVLLSEIPLVVAGSTAMNPYGKRATVLVEGLDDVAAACEAAIGHPEPTGV